MTLLPVSQCSSFDILPSYRFNLQFVLDINGNFAFVIDNKRFKMYYIYGASQNNFSGACFLRKYPQTESVA